MLADYYELACMLAIKLLQLDISTSWDSRRRNLHTSPDSNKNSLACKRFSEIQCYRKKRPFLMKIWSLKAHSATNAGHTVLHPHRPREVGVHKDDGPPTLRTLVMTPSALVLFSGKVMPTPSSLLLSLIFSSDEAALAFINGQCPFFSL